jgi:hypothetical protein
MLKKIFTLPAITLTLALAVSGHANQALQLEQATRALQSATSSGSSSQLIQTLSTSALAKTAIEALIGEAYDGGALDNVKLVRAIQSGSADAQKLAGVIVNLNTVIGSSTKLSSDQSGQINQIMTGLEVAQVTGVGFKKTNTNVVVGEDGNLLQGDAASAALVAAVSDKFGSEAGRGFQVAQKLNVLGADATKCAGQDFSHPIAVATTAALFEPMAKASDARGAVAAGFESASAELTSQHRALGNDLSQEDAAGRLCNAYAGVAQKCEIVKSGLTSCGSAN